MKFVKYVFLLFFMLFSFYFTEKISNFVLERNNLYQEIDRKKNKFNIESTSAVINDDYLIPGLNGRVVDVKNSFYNMRNIKKFNPYYLIYKDTYPKKSSSNYFNKIIKKGNKLKNSIALVVEYDVKTISYLNKYKISVLVNLEEYNRNSRYEQINNDFQNYNRLDNMINKYSKNTNICFVTKSNLKFCRKNNKILVEPTKILDNGSYYKIVNNIESGDIILIKKNTKLEHISIIIKNILFKDYNINFLSDHICEERN